MAPAPVPPLNVPTEVAALELNSTATAGAMEGTNSNVLAAGGASPRELTSTSSTAPPAPAPASVPVPYTKASRTTSLRPSVPRGPSRRQIMKLLPEDLRSALTAAGLDEHLEGLCEYFCALPGPDDAAALQGYLNPGSSSSANSGTSDGSTNNNSSSASIADGGGCHDCSASAGNFNSKGNRRGSRRSSSSSNSSSSSGGEVSKLADHNAPEEDFDPGSASGSNFTTVMAKVVSGFLSDRRVTPRAPEWKLCRRVLAAVNPQWRIARTHVAVGPDGRLEAVSQLLARASEDSVARLQDLGLALDEIASEIAAFEALEPPCKLDEFREAHGGNYTESDLLTLSQAANNTTSIAGPVPNFRLVLKLKFRGVFASVRGDIGSNSLLGKALRTLCAEVNEHWSLDRGADRGLDRTVEQGSERVHEGEASNFDFKKNPLVPTKQKAPSLTSGSTHKTKADTSGPRKYKGVAIHSRANKTWMSRISVDGNIKFLGIFNTAEEAARRWDEEAVQLGRTGLNFSANGELLNQGVDADGINDGGGNSAIDTVDKDRHGSGRYEDRNYMQPCVLSPPVPAPVVGPQALNRPFYEKPGPAPSSGKPSDGTCIVDAAGAEAATNKSNNLIGKATHMALLEAPVLDTLGGIPLPGSVYTNASNNRNKLNQDGFNDDASSQKGAADLLQPWPPTHSKLADGRWWTSAGLFTHTIAPAAARSLLGVVSTSSDGKKPPDSSNSSSHSASSGPSSSGCSPTTRQEFLPGVARSADPAYAEPSLGPSWLLSRARPAPVLHQRSTKCSNGAHRAANAPFFRGYSEKEFRDQWVDSAPFLDQRIISFAKKRNLCPRTSFRFATPSDADALVRINKVNARYLLADYQASTRAKNDFILVAVNQHGTVTGFVQYYFQHFAPSHAEEKRSKKGSSNGKSGGGRSGSSNLRPTPRPVAYVATLQTAKPSSHAEYLAAQSSNATQPAKSDKTGAASADVDTGAGVPVNGSGFSVAGNAVEKGTTSSLTETGAEARTGVVLMALALAHAHRDGKHYLFCDSTPDAVPFYRRFFDMESCLPTQDHPYVPMYAELSKLHPPDLLRPLAQPLHLPNPQQGTHRALCRLSPPTDSQPEVSVIANSLSSSLSTSSSPKSSSKSSPHVSSSLSSGKLAELSPKDNSAPVHSSFSSSSSSSSPPPPPIFASALSPASFTTSGLPPNTLPFVDARALVRSEKLLRAHWPQWRDDPTKRPSNVPAQPEEVYAQRGWAGWGDWLGLSQKSNDKGGSGDRNVSRKSSSSPTMASSQQQRALFGPMLDKDGEEREVCKRSREALDDHLNGATGWRAQGPLRLRLTVSPAHPVKKGDILEEHPNQSQPQQDLESGSMPRATITLLNGARNNHRSSRGLSSELPPGLAPASNTTLSEALSDHFEAPDSQEVGPLPAFRVLKTFEVLDHHARKVDSNDSVDDDGDINERSEAQEVGRHSIAREKATTDVGKRPRSRNGSGAGSEVGDEERKTTKRGLRVDKDEVDSEGIDADDEQMLRSHESSVLSELKRAQAKLAVLENQSLERAALLLSRVDEEASIVSSQQRTETLAVMADVNQRYSLLAQEASASLAAQRQRLEEDMEANCAVCSQGEVHVGQQIVFCEYCNVAVHQQCYGVGFIPDEDWFCAPCTATVSAVRRAAVAAATEKALQPPVACALCPARYRGAVFPTDNPEIWVHSLCADLAQVTVQPMVDIFKREQSGGGDNGSSSPNLAHVQSPHALGCSSKAIRAIQKAASRAAEAAAAARAASGTSSHSSSSPPSSSSSTPPSSSSGHQSLAPYKTARAIERFDPSTGALLEVYRSGVECASALGLRPSLVSEMAHGRKRGNAQGYVLRFQTQASSSSSLPSFGCVFCHTDVGALVTCADDSCQIRLHGTCATVAGCNVALVDEADLPKALNSLASKTSPVMPSTEQLSLTTAAAAANSAPLFENVPCIIDNAAIAEPATVEGLKKNVGQRIWRVHCVKHTTGLPARTSGALPNGSTYTNGRGKRRRGNHNGKDDASGIIVFSGSFDGISRGALGISSGSSSGKRALFNENCKGSTDYAVISTMNNGSIHLSGDHSSAHGKNGLDKTNAPRCHMCRARTSQPTAVCSSRIFFSPYRKRKCSLEYCADHIAAMGENPIEVFNATAEDGIGWDCYRCRNLCRCSVCVRTNKVPPMPPTNNHQQELSNGLPPNSNALAVRQPVNLPSTAPVPTMMPTFRSASSDSTTSTSRSHSRDQRARGGEERSGPLESFRRSCQGARCAVCVEFGDGSEVKSDGGYGHDNGSSISSSSSSNDYAFTSAQTPNPIMACRMCHVFVHYHCLNAATKPVVDGSLLSARSFLCNVCEDAFPNPSRSAETTNGANTAQERPFMNEEVQPGDGGDEIDRNCYVCPAPGGFRFRLRMPPPDESQQQQPSPSAGNLMYVHGFCMRALLDRATPTEDVQAESDGLAPETDFCCVCGDQSGIKFSCQAAGPPTHHGNGSDGNGDTGSNKSSNNRCANSFHPMCAMQAALSPGCCHAHSSRGALVQRIKRLLQFSSPEGSGRSTNVDGAGGALSPAGSVATRLEGGVEPKRTNSIERKGLHDVVSAAQFHYARAILEELFWANLPIGESAHVSPSFEALSCALRTFSTGDTRDTSCSITNHLSAVMLEVAVAAAQDAAAADRGRSIALENGVMLSASEASAAVQILGSVFEQACLRTRAFEPLMATPAFSAPQVLACGLCHDVDDLSNLNLCPGRHCSNSASRRRNTCSKHPNQSLEGSQGDSFCPQCSSEGEEGEHSANKRRRMSENGGSSSSFSAEKNHDNDDDDDGMHDDYEQRKRRRIGSTRREEEAEEAPACVAAFHPACAGWAKHPGGSNALVRQGVAARCDASGHPMVALRCPSCTQASSLYGSPSSENDDHRHHQVRHAKNEHAPQQQPYSTQQQDQFQQQVPS